jgi:DNA-binding SARP family transcriptional activator
VVGVCDEYVGLRGLICPSLISSLLSSFDPLNCSAVLLFGDPHVLCDRERLEVPDGSKRLLAFVALSAGRVDRGYAAGSLWPMSGDQRAAGNLRSALWRLKSAGIDVLESDKWALALRRRTVVDVGIVWEWATRLVDGSATRNDLFVANWRGNTLDLLPAWDDDWVIFERERLRQRLLHALEVLSRRLVEASRSADAVDAAMWVVSADPLRESANRVLIEAHLAEGNIIEARRTYRRYCNITRRELGVEPSGQLTSLMRARIPPQFRPAWNDAATRA